MIKKNNKIIVITMKLKVRRILAKNPQLKYMKKKKILKMGKI